VSKAIRTLSEAEQRRADQRVRDLQRYAETEKERMHNDKSKFVVGVRKKLNRLIGMHKGIYHDVEDGNNAHMQHKKGRLLKVIDST